MVIWKPPPPSQFTGEKYYLLPSYLHICLALTLRQFPSPRCSVGLINGWCQKHCQSILCLFGFIWTSGVVRGGDEGDERDGGVRGVSKKGGFWEVVTTGESEKEEEQRKRSGSWGDRRRRIMGAVQQHSLSRWTSGTHWSITSSLLIFTQRALCQKSDTVRALWTSSPFKCTRRAFMG